MTYARRKFIASQKKVLLEIILPPEMDKGPKAMESFFSAIHISPGESTFIDVYFKGSTRPWWSFELVSIEGDLHFYIWTWAKFKDLIITQLKANYPDIKIIEVEDYLNGVVPDLDKVEIWGTDYKFVNDDVYPIKSYIDWGLDKIEDKHKLERIVDPLDTVFEKFASLGEGETAVLHIMIQATKNKNWKKDVEKEIDKIYESRATEYPDFTDPEKMVKGLAQLRPQDYDLVNTLRHSMEKDAFDVAMRSVYIARKDKFNPQRIGVNHVHLYRAFEVPHLNYPIGIANWLAGYDYPWQDPKQKERTSKKKKIIDALRRRQYFHTPYNLTVKTPPMIMTTEELATIYHFPIGKLKRIKKAQANPPDNLPR